jgi:hypothetical protein
MYTLLPLLSLLACGSLEDGSAPQPDVDSQASETQETQETCPADTLDTGTEQDTETEPQDTGSSDTAPQDTATEPEEELSDFEACFGEILAEPGESAPDYGQFSPEIGSHCAGTNHQEITGVERVVFLGDSITVGTLPTLDYDLYRNRLAMDLASHFGLDAPDLFWQAVDLFAGTTISQESGDFASCAEYGARTDDLMRDGDQVLDCFPDDQRDKTTLVVMTIGSNDLASLAQDFVEEEKTHEEMWTETESTMQLLREAVEWIVEPGRFPNGVYVVFTNQYEFTDATGDVTSCPLAALAGFSAAITDPALEEMVIWSMEQYMSIATETGTDMLFLLESFCGHGFNYDDTTGRCYRGSAAELWFDLTCIHPNPTGHGELADMFMATILE